MHPDAKSPRSVWLRRLDAEDKAHKTFRQQAANAQAEYYDADSANVTRSYVQVFPAFWSLINREHASLFSRMPRPDVRKRNVDYQTGTDKQLALLIERALSFTQDTTGFDIAAHQSVQDFLIGGLGVAKCELDITTGEQQVINPVDGSPVVDEQGEPMLETVIVSQAVRMRYVPLARYRWEPTTAWAQVSWMSFDHYMGRDEFEAAFDVILPDTGNTGSGSEAIDKKKSSASKYAQQICVHEIWDRTTKTVIYVSPDYADEFKAPVPDPLGLKEFFPCARPMMANVAGEEVLPKPDHTLIAPLLKLINTYSVRIAKLTAQVRDYGYYDASFADQLGKISQAADGTFFPVPMLLDRLAANGGTANLDKVVSRADNRPAVAVIQNLIDQRARCMALLDQATGITDIQRGATNPNETASAQRLKDQWSNVSMAVRLDVIAKFFRDMFRIMAEVISEHFEPDQLYAMTGIEVTPEMSAIMQDDLTRAYTIDVETDSTIAQDDSLEREQRNETSQTITGMLQNLLPAVQSGALPADLVKTLMLFTVRTTKFGREFEDSIQTLPDNMAQLQQATQATQQAQEELQQCQQQLQQAQQQLSQVSEAQEQRENLKATTAAEEKRASAAKQNAEAMRIAQGEAPEQSDYNPMAEQRENIKVQSAAKQADASATRQHAEAAQTYQELAMQRQAMLQAAQGAPFIQ